MDKAVQAADITPEKVKWLWPANRPDGGAGLIPRGVISIVAGRPDQGKGLFGAYLAADVSRRGERVLLSAAEDDAKMMTRPRLEAAGANLKNVLLWRFVLPRQGPELEKVIRDEKIKLVIMDPMAAHLSGTSRFSDRIRDVLNPLTKVIEETGTAVVIIEHALKRVKKDSHPLDAIGGSGSGLAAAARMAYLFGVDPEDDERRVLAPAKANLRQRPNAVEFEVDVDEFPIVGDVPSLQYIGEKDEGFQATALVSTAAANESGGLGRRPDKRAAASEWLTNYLVDAGKPIPSGTIQEDAKQNGMTVKTLRRAAEDMKVVKDPPGGGRNCTWDLPDDVKQIMGVKKTKRPKKPKDDVDTKPVKADDVPAPGVNDAFDEIVKDLDIEEPTDGKD